MEHLATAATFLITQATGHIVPQLTKSLSHLAKHVYLTTRHLEVRFKNFCRCRPEPSRIFTSPQVLVSNWLLTRTVFVGIV